MDPFLREVDAAVDDASLVLDAKKTRLLRLAPDHATALALAEALLLKAHVQARLLAKLRAERGGAR